ncbi:mechanosensitive ion channel domain-containing protein [Maribellus sp. YY47]|uniref:mechanosensitive ion channel family protein n=1 Tax=Maribellus sp. YY47 TaxID=2929486 RepID=UPI002001B2DF|nr:mechanosensitive ion channel domain-containing protein [Maribellus sp. YY47]MCK3684873.1 mechanosensitive ion channel [Maribellus sp. YY47]
MEAFEHLLDYQIFKYKEFVFSLKSVLIVLFAVVVTHLFLWIIKKILFRKKKSLDPSKQGNLISVFQIIKYFVWVITILIILESFGLKLTVLMAGSAALLVGVGLGLQSTFNDFVSGLILLFEGSIRVGDILEVDGEILLIRKIGLRTSEALTRDDIMVIIPNSLITNSKVINWSHQSKKTRFRIKVGVAYGSDIDLVERLLKESAAEHPEVVEAELIKARFVDFGSSSLDFELLFFSKNIFRIENVKSDIRKTINRKFVENKVTIPFPQLDLHMKSGN